MTPAIISIRRDGDVRSFDVRGDITDAEIGMALVRLTREMEVLKQRGRVTITKTVGNLTKIIMVSR